MTLSHSEILKKASELGICRSEAARIGNSWFGSPAPSEMLSQMAWQSLFIDTADKKNKCFRSEEFLLEQARFRRCSKKGNRVTDFSGWVFNLCFPGKKRNSAALQMGKDTEDRLLQRNRARRLLRLPEPEPQSRHWEMIFRDPLTDVESFRISTLKVNGKALYGVPDIVYRNAKTGEIMIVEIKASNAEVPLDGWPNLRTQLWCYAQIDQWADAPKITLVGQVWKPGATTLRKTLIWDNASRSFQEGCRNLFDAYAKCEIRMVKK